MKLLNRFLKYVKIDTTSNSKIEYNPSSSGQLELAKMLCKELKSFNLEVDFDEENCYLYAKMFGNPNLPKIGFVAHLDTSENAPGNNINPKVTYNYDGSSIILNEDKNLNPDVYPDLKNHTGKTIITTDGTTLLGADDKAGIAEIMQLVEYFSLTEEEHGDIYICFTPDEEIGLGTLNLNYEKFNPDFAYTIDGSSIGELSYENFNAASAIIKINGINTHAGSAKGIMINAVRIATIINSLLPDEIPENTEGYEGFYHLEEIKGNVSYTIMKYLIRDFDKNNFEKRKLILKEIISKLNKKYDNAINLEIKDSYKNMVDIINKYPNLIENTLDAIKEVNIEPEITEIRGGTDGTKISYNGIPCPNIGTGGHNFHSVYEYICLEDMEKTTQLLISLVKQFSKEKVSYKILEKEN